MRQLNPEEVKVKVILANESDAEVKGFVDHVQVERISKELLKKSHTVLSFKGFPLTP
ncbi:MAG: hypothetical protein IPH04_13900 [Saprospirales bacterium]|nr:hypothetical protein [Saprospirales bacterium]